MGNNADDVHPLPDFQNDGSGTWVVIEYKVKIIRGSESINDTSPTITGASNYSAFHAAAIQGGSTWATAASNAWGSWWSTYASRWGDGIRQSTIKVAP